MQLNFKRFLASFLFVISAIGFVYPQTETTPKTDNPPSSTDVMRDRITKAKAHIVVKNYNAAIYELENIKRETSDQAVDSVANVLLMNCYLEQTDYAKAQEFLNKFYKDIKANNAFAQTNYYAVAGQIVKGARNQLERYRGIGLSVADRNLPLEALLDIDKMRETLEIVVAQTRELGADKKQNNQAMPLLEEAMNARVALSKDDYDANNWKRQVADARETMVDSRSTVIDATNGKPIVEAGNAVAANNTVNPSKTTTSNNPPTTQTANNNITKTPEIGFKPVNNTTQAASAKPVKTSEIPKENLLKTPEIPKENPVSEPAQPQETVAANTKQTEDTKQTKNKRKRIVIGDKPTEVGKVKEQPNLPETIAQTDNSENTKPAENSSPLEVGSLVEYATKRVNPVYPSAARNIRQTGVVKVEIVIDEDGNVSEINTTSGPSMLQRAATDALKKWQFKPFLRDGVPVKAVGFVNFNFTL